MGKERIPANISEQSVDRNDVYEDNDSLIHQVHAPRTIEC